MDIVFNFNGVMLLQLTLAVFLPVAVGLVTKFTTNSNMKAILLLALSTITALLTQLADAVVNNVPYDLGQGVYMAIVTFVVGVATHYGLWKPTHVTEAAQAALVKDPTPPAEPPALPPNAH